MSEIASDAVKQGDNELSLAALAKYSNTEYLSKRGEPVLVAFLTALLGVGKVREERAPSEHRRNRFPELENVAATERAEHMRMSALVTCVDASLKSTNAHSCHLALICWSWG